MDILFIIDPLASLKSYKDSTVAMMRAAAKRHHRIWTAEPKDFYWRDGVTKVEAHRIEVAGNDKDWYCVVEDTKCAVAEFTAALKRKDPPFDMEYVYATYLLELAQAQGARIFNQPNAVRDHNEKLAILQHSEFIPPTVVTSKMLKLQHLVVEWGDVIVKPLDGMGGASVFRCRPDDPNLNVILETITAHGTRTIMAQRYLPEIVNGDKRILLIAGEPVPHALARIPQGTETRGNMAAGGKPVVRPMTDRDWEIAREMGKRLWAKGLFLVGLDVIGDSLTEINVTSPTGFVEITQQTGFDVAAFFMERLESVCAD